MVLFDLPVNGLIGLESVEHLPEIRKNALVMSNTNIQDMIFLNYNIITSIIGYRF